MGRRVHAEPSSRCGCRVVSRSQRLIVGALAVGFFAGVGAPPVGADVTERVSVASDGTQANDGSWFPALSADGRIVAFESRAANLVQGDTNRVFDIFVHDRQTGVTERVSVASDGAQANNLPPPRSPSARTAGGERIT